MIGLWILAALAAWAVVVHLLVRLRRREFVLPSTALLRQVLVQSSAVSQLRNWVILASRLALAGVLAWMLYAFTLSKTGDRAVYIDASMSMLNRSSGLSLLEIARQQGGNSAAYVLPDGGLGIPSTQLPVGARILAKADFLRNLKTQPAKPILFTDTQQNLPDTLAALVDLRVVNNSNASAYIDSAWLEANGARLNIVLNGPATEAKLYLLPNELVGQAALQAGPRVSTLALPTSLRSGNYRLELATPDAPELTRYFTFSINKPRYRYFYNGSNKTLISAFDPTFFERVQDASQTDVVLADLITTPPLTSKPLILVPSENVAANVASLKALGLNAEALPETERQSAPLDAALSRTDLLSGVFSTKPQDLGQIVAKPTIRLLGYHEAILKNTRNQDVFSVTTGAAGQPIYLFNQPLDDRYTDIASSELFVPLLYQPLRQVQSTGQPAWQRFDALTNIIAMNVVSADSATVSGTSITGPVRMRTGGQALAALLRPGFLLPGSYQIARTGKESFYFSVNPPKAELRYPAERQSSLPGFAAITKSKSSSVFTWLGAIAVALLLVEGLLLANRRSLVPSSTPA